MSGTIKYLLNMKRLPILIMMVIAGSFLAFKTMGTGRANPNPPSKYEDILRLVGKMLNEAHYSPQSINDAFSKKVFTKFLGDLDPEKNIFTQSDIDGLKKYENKIDDELKGSPVEFFLAAGKQFNARLEEASAIYNDYLSHPFDFTTNEEVELDGDKLKFSNSEAERKDRWRKKMKYLTLDRYVDLLSNWRKKHVRK
jgi:carboxyl-terminal processing protease